MGSAEAYGLAPIEKKLARADAHADEGVASFLAAVVPPLPMTDRVESPTSPPQALTVEDLRERTQAFRVAADDGCSDSELVLRLRALLPLLRSGLDSTLALERTEALRLYAEAFQHNSVRLITEGALWADVESISECAVGFLADQDQQTQVSAVNALITSAQLPALGLMTVLDHVHCARQAVRNSGDFCCGMCLFLVTALEYFLGNDATKFSDTAMSKVMLQAAVWDAAPLIQQGLAGVLGCKAKETATKLAVAVYVHLGVDESSQLLEGLEISVIRSVFEHFVEAEERGCAMAQDEAYTPSEASPAKLARENDPFIEKVLEDVELAFADDRILREKDKPWSSPTKRLVVPLDSPAVDEDLVHLGLSDDLLQWACDVLVEDA